MDKLADIPVIVPSLQPDDRIIHVARELLASGLQNIIVIDDGSGPNYSSYYEELTDLGCTVIHHAVNLGKGRALKTAFNYCFLNFPDLVGCVTVDSDGQHSVQNALECIEALTMHPHCLIMGCRDFSSDNVPFKNRYGNKITVGMFKTICGVSCSDTQTGLRAIPADFMRTLMNVSGERFEFESYMLVESKKCGFKIFEVPIETIYQETYTTHFNPFRDSLRIYAIFFKYIASSVFSTCVDLALF
ncbi:MAG: glycosyltransferase family 2 protein, partial [Oscillospiraceae bacterium]